TDTIYDGNTKTVKPNIIEGSVIGNDEVLIEIEYFGDRINSTLNGFNVVISSISGADADNYTISNMGNITNFKIELAKIDSGVSFKDEVRNYDGLSHRLEVTGELENVSVIYSAQNIFREPGSYTISVTLTKTNYEELILTATMTINRVAMNITNLDLKVDGIDDLRYGQAMPRITVLTEDGSATFKEGLSLAVGTYEYEWEFTPSDSNYLKSTGKIELKVNKALTTISISGLTGIDQFQDAIQVINNFGSVLTSSGLRYKFTSEKGIVYLDEIPAIPGNYMVEITYEGDENNDPVTYTFYYYVEKSQSNDWVWVVSIGGAALVGLVIVVTLFRRKRSN
ncbi:MAG: hypothetical protein LBF68_02175, partial [Christensenellaceae bacterium]|nr:hypothetical protein [Christensenellaceae bacterium]